MPINRFRSDAPARPKIIRLLGPGGSGVVQAEITCGNRLFTFAEWNATTIAAALTASEVPEFAELTFEVDGDDVVVTGPDDDDFIISMAYRPTVTITNEAGVTARNQQTRLYFDGARAGTYTLTINGKTTAAIDYGDQSDLITQIELLSGWTAGDAIVVSATPDVVILEFTETLAGSPVAVTMDASNLHNGRTITIREATPYRPSPHDVWILSMDASTTCSVTIDGTSATLRSDMSRDQVAEILQSLSSRTLNVYGGPSGESDGDGITYCHYVLDFVGWDASTRPTVSVTDSDGTAEVVILSNPTSATGFTGVISNAQTGRVNHWLLDFTTGEEIIVEYDGIEVSLAAPASAADASTAATEIRTSLRDASEYDEVLADYSAFGFGALGNPNGWRSAYFIHILNTNESIVQTGGTGTLRRLNYAGTAAAGAVHEIYTPARTNGGTFRLTLPEGSTASLSGVISSGDLQTALAALVASTTVSGSGTPLAPWVVTYPVTEGVRVLPIAESVSLAGNGTGTATEIREALRGVTQKARFSVSTNATGGSFAVFYGTQGPVWVTLGDSAATVDAALATLPGIASGANIVTAYDAESETYDITFDGSLVDQLLPLFSLAENALDVTSSTTIEVTQAATGPRNIADPDNWSLGRMPHAMDTIVFEASVGDARYGLRQWVQVTANTSTEKLTAAAGHDLRAGQIVRFLTAGTLPTGISAGTDYYVLDPDNEAGTFRVSTTATGTAVNITGAGSGDIFCGVLATDIRIAASFTDQIGREERTSQNSAEYLPRYLQLGLASGGVCEIGGGNSGRGSSLIRLDLGYSLGTVQIVRTDSTGEIDRPSCAILADSGSLAVDVVNGDVGLAAFESESVIVGAISQNSGTLFCGDATAASLTKQGGRLLSRSLTVSGEISIKG